MAPLPRAAHYARLDDADSQTSPGEVRAGLERWLDRWPVAPPVLDVGCGVGANLGLLTSRGLEATGSEISSSAARVAAAAAASAVVVADGQRLPFPPGTFGAAICTEVLEHVDDPGAVLAEMARVLRPGGLAYVTTPNYANLSGVHKWLADRSSGRHDWNPWGAHAGGYEAFMTGRRLAAAASPHFEILAVRGLDFGQALTGRFRPLDRLAASRRAAGAVSRLLSALYRRDEGPVVRWHGMHIELTLRRRAA